jgi:hypothetical protein
MRHARVYHVVLWFGLACFVLPGCLALSFGGKSQQVDTVVSESPEMKSRLSDLERRVETLERQAGAPLILPPGTTSLNGG